MGRVGAWAIPSATFSTHSVERSHDMSDDPGSEERNWATACLRIRSPIVRAAAITAALSMQPSKTFEQDTLVNPRRPDGAIRTEGLWILDSPLPDTQPLEAHVLRLLELCEERISQLRELAPRCQFDLSCALAANGGQAGFILEAEIMRRLAAIPLDLVLDLYPPAAGE